MQFSHALKTHEHTVCTLQDIVHLHKKEIDCSLYHFQIENNTIDFSISYSPNEFNNFQQEILTAECEKILAQPHYKSSRAPPSLLF